MIASYLPCSGVCADIRISCQSELCGGGGVGRAPTSRFHKAGDRSLEAALAGDLGLLLISVVALHSLEVLAEEFVMVEIALDEFALVLARLFLAGGEIGAADDKFGQHDLRR